MNSPGDPIDLSGLDRSCRALTRTVDALTPDDLAAPSLLPDWTRAHVVAHLALNGLALAGAVDGLAHGRNVAMYASDQERNDAIDELAAAGPSALRERHLEATTAFSDAVRGLPAEHWSGHIERLPGGPTWPMGTVVASRRREVEIHHADLGAAYTHADWPDDFVVELLDAVSVDQAGSGPFEVRAPDLARSWSLGTGAGPTVTGTGADIGWWLTGRGAGAGLTCDSGGLPELQPWRRAATPAP